MHKLQESDKQLDSTSLLLTTTASPCICYPDDTERTHQMVDWDVLHAGTTWGCERLHYPVSQVQLFPP